MPPVDLPKDAEVVVLGKAGPALPGRILLFSDIELTIESVLDEPVYAPVRVSWDSHIALGEVLETHGDGASRVTKVLLHHFMDLAAATESSTYWS
jgi:hypothetical protein